MISPLRTGMSQRQSIKKFLEDGYSLTALEALSLFGAYRLAAHIHVLRLNHGMSIFKEMNTDVTGRTYARYKLDKSAPMSRASTFFAIPVSTQKEMTFNA